MAYRLQGPIGVGKHYPIIDRGTLARSNHQGQRLIGSLSVVANLRVSAGKTERDVGFNFDGSAAEDTLYADQPSQSAPIRKDDLFTKSDQELFNYLWDLMNSMSWGNMNTVAKEMCQLFIDGSGGIYSSDKLDREVAGNSAFSDYDDAFKKKIVIALSLADYDITRLSVLRMNLLNFSSLRDEVTGLGITVHQVWAAKAELFDYAMNVPEGRWACRVEYTFYDHFGLDWEDVVKNGDRRLPKYHTGDGFKAWYILQHYRNAQPFITKITVKTWLFGEVE